jgi:hypothetical protein
MDDSICWPPSATGWDSIWWNPPLADEPPPLADDFLHPWPTSSFSMHVVGLLPRHDHLINAGRRRGTLATGTSSKPDTDGRLDLLASFGDRARLDLVESSPGRQTSSPDRRLPPPLADIGKLIYHDDYMEVFLTQVEML